jgi:hypothetical protein
LCAQAHNYAARHREQFGEIDFIYLGYFRFDILLGRTERSEKEDIHRHRCVRVVST